MVEPVVILLALMANEYQVIALRIGAVFIIICFDLAMDAFANYFSIARKVHFHAAIKNVQATFP